MSRFFISKFIMKFLVTLMIMLQLTLSLEEKEITDYAEPIQEKINKWQEIKNDLTTNFQDSEYASLVISKNKRGFTFISPDANDKTVNIYSIPKFSEYMDGIDYDISFSKKDLELNGQFRLAPRMGDVICIKSDSSNMSLVGQEVERFRGNLFQNLAYDGRILQSLKKFSSRMLFYKQIMQSVSQIGKNHLKHCDLHPHSFLYKEKDANFDSDYANGEETLTFFPVITNFIHTKPWEANCSLIINNKTDEILSGSTSDPDDYNKEIKYLDNFKERVEVFSVALIILWVEATVLQAYAKEFSSAKESLNEQLTQLPNPSNAIIQTTHRENPFLKLPLNEIVEELYDIVKLWNNMKEQTGYSYDLLDTDIKYITSGLAKFNDFYIANIGYDSNQISSISSIYSTFGEMLQKMVYKNDKNPMKLRPHPDDVVAFFEKAYQSSSIIEPQVRRNRRIILV